MNSRFIIVFRNLKKSSTRRRWAKRLMVVLCNSRKINWQRALQFVVIFYNPRKKPQDDNKLGGLSLFSLTQEKTHKMTMSQEACHHFLQPKKQTTRQRWAFWLVIVFYNWRKNTKDNPRGLSSSFVHIKHPVGSSSMPTHMQTRGGPSF